ncbi:MAG TPA: hypothetical protein VED40_18970 [Azospirillaceae bacterium]|nr:hypothetical protein [Azospirillaceae bacterium]
MADILTIRELDPQVHEALRRRAAAAGRSMEAEAREILRAACLPATNEDWFEGAKERALARTGGRILEDSTPIIREARDTRYGE